jgi:NADH:ubiquinone oxidoreductase subunit 6 (subunit J)
MIIELLAVGLVVSALFAVHLDDAIYSIASLAFTVFLVAALYSLNGAPFAAVFQLALGAGTLTVLFLSGELLSKKAQARASLKYTLLVCATALLLSVPPILLSVGTVSTELSSDTSFPESLWNLRAVDVVLQGLVILIVALGTAIVLYERRGSDG